MAKQAAQETIIQFNSILKDIRERRFKPVYLLWEKSLIIQIFL